MSAELSDFAMGASLTIAVNDEASELLPILRDLVVDLERRWTRFSPDSEVSRLSAAGGHPAIVSEETERLLACAEAARVATAGRFNPLMLDSIISAGYDRNLLPMNGRRASDSCRAVRSSGLGPTPEDLSIHCESGVAWLPRGFGFDPGGIGKGLAADLIAEEGLRLGAASVMANLGGDIRVAGRSPHGPHWDIDVAPAEAAASGSAGPQRVRIALDEGGVATSGITKRRWAGGHHLIDPSTGRPADTGIERVTVIAAETWWAEVVATAIAVSSVADGLELLDGLSLPGRVTLTCGEEVASPDWTAFLVDPAEIGTRS